LSRANAGRVNLRYLAPPALVLFSLIGLVLGIIGETLDSKNEWGQLLKLGFAPLSIYLLGVGLVAVLSKTKQPVAINLSSRIALLVVLPTMHIFWGAGFLFSVLKKS